MTTETEIPLRAEFEGHFEGLAAHSLRFPRCGACGRFHWYPMPGCPRCGSDAVQWHAVAGRGRLWSWTVVRHAYAPELRDRLPYVVALMTFDDAPGVRLVTNVVGVDPAALAIGMELDPVFRSDATGRPRVEFGRAAAHG